MKIRYAVLAAVVALGSLIGNGLFVYFSETSRIVLIVSENGLGGIALSKWFLLLFAVAAFAFTLAYLLMRLYRARREMEAEKEKLEDRSMLIASGAVLVMGWIVSLMLL